jgi:hypothetical protein
MQPFLLTEAESEKTRQVHAVKENFSASITINKR